LKSIHQILNRQYYKKSSWILFLLPLSFIYLLIIYFRIWAYKVNILKSTKLNVPLVVIGNITLGGTGKTPLVIWLLKKLIKLDMKPGLICSGYNSKATLPQEVFINSKVTDVGDEALMTKLNLNNEKSNYIHIHPRFHLPLHLQKPQKVYPFTYLSIVCLLIFSSFIFINKINKIKRNNFSFICFFLFWL